MENGTTNKMQLISSFDAIKTLDFSNEPKSIDILAMLSPEGERLQFIKTVKARGNVESWLSAVEEGVITSSIFIV